MELYVFSPALQPLGVFNIISDLSWEIAASGAGSWEVWCSLTEDNLSLAIEDNVVCLDEEPESAGVIELVNLVSDSDGLKKLHLAGRTCEIYLDFRTVFPMFNGSGILSSVIYSLVEDNLVDPADSNRKIATVELDPQRETIGPTVRYQQTGGSLLEEVRFLCSAGNLRFCMRFSHAQGKLYFGVYPTYNRSIDQLVNTPVYLSSELDDILESEYTVNKADYKGVAYVLGEDTGTARKFTTLGSDTGVYRRELFVDARDLQSETEEGQMTEAQYLSALEERGKADLQKYASLEVFNASLRLNGNTYRFGEDFYLGDTITVYDARLHVRADVVVSSTVLTYSGGQRNRDFVFGFSQPTVAEKIKRRS